MKSAVCQSIDEVDPKQWNSLNGTDSPFLRHEFLAALEHTGCVGVHTGWQPTYVTLTDSARPRRRGAGVREKPIPTASSCSISAGRRPTTALAATTTRRMYWRSGACESILSVLADGRAFTAGELSAVAGVTPQTASGHLLRMVDAGLLTIANQGRHRYY